MGYADRDSLDNSASIDLDLVNVDEGRYLVGSSPFSEAHPKK